MMKRSLRRNLILFAVMATALTLSSCVPEAFGPDITTVSVSPSTIQQSNTGMTDEYVDVTINTSGFDGEFQSAEVFIQLPGGENRFSQGSFEPVFPGDPSQIESVDMTITKSWFGGLDAGVYNIGATVETDLEDYRELDVATVEITAN